MELYFNNTLLTDETIIKTRQHFYDLCMGAIEEIKSGKVYVNDINKAIEWELISAGKYLNGENDRVLAFLQRAYYLQTGESVALLGF